MSRGASLEVNNKIRQSLANTREKRKTQTCKVYELKVNCHQTSKETLKEMNLAFEQAKWVVNDMIASDDLFHYDYKDHKTVIHFDKDKNPVSSQITLSSVMHRAVIKQKQQDIVNESKAKKKGRKVGRLKFKSEINTIPILTGPWLRIRGNTRITIPGFANIKVYGMEQFRDKNYELADAKFIRKPSGFYIHLSVMFQKTDAIPMLKGKAIGLDFGIKNNLTDSEGNTYSCQVRETDQLKFLQRQLHRKQKGSKRYWKLRNQIQREYEYMGNKKRDDANKLVSKLKKENDCIYFQDEQLANWKKIRSFGKTIQHSYLGLVKAKLNTLCPSGQAYKINKYQATTKICLDCDTIVEGMTLNDRQFVCPNCGLTEDRDVHAAKNMIRIGRLLKKTEWLEQPSADKSSSADGIHFIGKKFRRSEKEDSRL